MRRSLMVSLLVFSNLLYEAQGIRLGKDSLSAKPKIQEVDRALIKRSNGGVGEVILCKNGHCSGMNRKLCSKTTPTSISATTSKNYKNEGNKAHEGQEEIFSVNSSPVAGQPGHREAAADRYPDISDLAGMDYSPAKRKPPIHN